MLESRHFGDLKPESWLGLLDTTYAIIMMLMVIVFAFIGDGADQSLSRKPRQLTPADSRDLLSCFGIHGDVHDHL